MAEIDAEDPSSFRNFPNVDPEDTAFINQTSGTTGAPKKVQHSHFDIINSTNSHSKDTNITDDDVLYNCRPMAYIGGYPFGYITLGSENH